MLNPRRIPEEQRKDPKDKRQVRQGDQFAASLTLTLNSEPSAACPTFIVQAPKLLLRDVCVNTDGNSAADLDKRNPCLTT